MTKMMRAAFAEAPAQDLAIREVQIPEPGRGQVLVRINASGVCHTDISLIDGDWQMKPPTFPFIPGHEGAGVVAALGPGVSGLKEGDPVGLFWLNSACGECEYCATSREPFCTRQAGTGYTAGGTFAEYSLVSGEFAVPLPAGEPDHLAPIMCAGVTAYKAVKLTGVKRDDWIVVMGVGGTGHLAIQYAKAMELKVVAIDIDDDKVALAETLGVDMAINASRRFPVNRVSALTGGAHGAVVAAGSPKAYDQALRMLRRGGVCVVVGISKEPMTLSPFDIVIKGLTVRGSLIGTRADLREALNLVSCGKVTPHVDTRPFEDINEALARLRSGQITGRAVMQMV